MTDLTTLSVRDASRGIAAGQLSPVDLVDAFLRRIEAHDAALHAYVEVYADDARAAAQAAELAIRSGHRLGPLHGIPIAIKDLVEIEGRIVTGGSAIWRDRRSVATATIARRLIEQGAIILGKTHTVEFALGGWGTNRHMGTPRNPWDLEHARTPGGSSSGSAVAVAARLAPWAIGTDTGGSLRTPAAYCGVTTLKVSKGRISTHGILPLCPTLDTPGPMAHDVEDVALLYGALQGRDPHDRSTWGLPGGEAEGPAHPGVAGLRFGRLNDTELSGVAPEVLEAYHRSLAVLERAGATISIIEFPHSFAEVAILARLISATEGYALLGHLAEDPDLPIDADVRPRLLAGRDVRASDYVQALHKREAMQRETSALFSTFDAVLTPTTETPALLLEEVDQTKTPSRFSRFANFFDLCALALPDGVSAENLPLSLQIVTRNCGEWDALRIGRAYQDLTDWHRRRPAGL